MKRPHGAAIPPANSCTVPQLLATDVQRLHCLQQPGGASPALILLHLDNSAGTKVPSVVSTRCNSPVKITFCRWQCLQQP
mmetsp:Transcript_42749/g.128317  ORF Transcript_42749/g.128317 Transcript_42749/m.128317 type:complete len:80 (+) Transcript_42749:933-1172(+)